MLEATSSLPNFLIAGTEKAGTTSVFVYLSQHPQVCASSRKETDFFRNEFSGDRQRDEAAYAGYFRKCTADQHILMEASPAYLGEADIVAPRIHALLPDAKLLFILREPIARLYSAYNFYVSRLSIPKDLSFDDFVQKCFAYQLQGAKAEDLGVGEWYLKTLRFGRYSDCLARYIEIFPPENIKVMFFESLSDDVYKFMHDLSDFIAIDQEFWTTFEFGKSNVTFAGRNSTLHRVALRLNDLCEPLLRQRPVLKSAIVKLYKSLNQAADRPKPIGENVRKRLVAYYGDSATSLATLLGEVLPESWSHLQMQQDRQPE